MTPQWLAEWETPDAHTAREAFTTELAAQRRADQLVNADQLVRVVVYEVSGRYLTGRTWGVAS